MTINRETAQLFEKVAAVFRVKEGDTFRVKAYTNAATAIENLSEPIDDLWRQSKLDTIPGLGAALQGYLDEYFRKGRVRHFDSQLKKVPAGMFALMSIPGVGPMTAYKIAHKFHLKSEKTALADLQKLLKAGKLSAIEGFREKSITKISESLKHKTLGKNRTLLSDALAVAERYISYLKSSPHIKDAEPLGSLRRKLSTVGDIDLAISSDVPEKALADALEYPEISFVVTKGTNVCHVKLRSGFEIDIKVASPEDWGSLLQHFTGSKMHNIHLRTLVKEKGFSLSEAGITKSGKLHHFKTEKDFYGFLGFPLIPVELREDTGEIELAQKGSLPNLVELKEIKGDLHVHSNFNFASSHDLGDSSLHEILDQAYDLGYEYLGLSDHNPKFMGLSEKEKEMILTERKKFLEHDFRAYENRVKNRGIKLLIGLEVDIRPNGELALSDTLLNTLDYTIVSIHSGFDQSREVTTARILKALIHPKAIIFGHPTGRIINHREPVNADWEKIFDFCAKNNKILEVNAYPDRSDLPDNLIRQAINQGVKIIIDTDSHDASHMTYMKFGVSQARKGYATKKDIVNTLSWQKFQSVLK